MFKIPNDSALAAALSSGSSVLELIVSVLLYNRTDVMIVLGCNRFLSAESAFAFDAGPSGVAMVRLAYDRASAGEAALTAELHCLKPRARIFAEAVNSDDRTCRGELKALAIFLRIRVSFARYYRY